MRIFVKGFGWKLKILAWKSSAFIEVFSFARIKIDNSPISAFTTVNDKVNKSYKR